MLTVRKDLSLMWKVGAARINQIDARQVVLSRDLLRTQMLLDGQRKISPAFNSRVVRNDQHLSFGHAPNPGNDAGARRFAAVKPVGGEWSDLQERRPGIEEARDSLARQELAALLMSRACGFRSPQRHLSGARTQTLYQSEIMRSEDRRAGQSRGQPKHRL
jgi:hypothetical protein